MWLGIKAFPRQYKSEFIPEGIQRRDDQIVGLPEYKGTFRTSCMTEPELPGKTLQHPALAMEHTQGGPVVHTVFYGAGIAAYGGQSVTFMDTNGNVM